MPFKSIHLADKFIERFWERVDRRGPDECWNYHGKINESGYGRYREMMAHRIAYTLLVAPVPNDLTIHHACRNKLCCNPAHHELMTTADNRHQEWGKHPQTHCKRGHPLEAPNLYIVITKSGHIKRVCRKCRYIRHRRRYLKIKEARNHPAPFNNSATTSAAAA